MLNYKLILGDSAFSVFGFMVALAKELYSGLLNLFSHDSILTKITF